ncbi:MAG TPA: Nudix family hydrolase [Agitococcus sp.]|nr:Nudix family hydrolase [Agitococcus sp.]
MLNVVAAVIHNSHGQLLLAQRPLHKHQGGLWEFAGGKVDAGETAEQALVRELQEELGITATQYRSLLTVEHHYPDKSVRLNVFRVTAFDGEAHGAEGQPIVWVKPENLYDYQFPAANLSILKAAVLPDMYCMTPEPTDVGGDLFAWLNQHLAQHSFLCLRAKKLTEAQYLTLAQQVAELCQQRQCTLIIHQHYQLLAQLPFAKGVHLTSQQLAQGQSRQQFAISPKQYLWVSAHDQQDLAKAWLIGADAATLSPVCPTASHPTQPAMGWQVFQDTVKTAKLPVYALGGMTKDDIGLAQQYGGQGIAGIRGLFT